MITSGRSGILEEMMIDDLRRRLDTIDQRDLKPADAVSEAMTIYLELAGMIAELREVQAQAKAVISDVFVEIGTDKLETPAGHVYVTKPSMRVSYDTKGLDALARERPDLGVLLARYRVERPVAGTLTIRARRQSDSER